MQELNKYNTELPVKGLYLDIEPEKQPPGTYRFALNILNDSSEGSIHSVVNEPGNEATVFLPEGFSILGHVPLNNNNVLLILTDISNVIQIGIVDEVYQYNKLIESNCFSFDDCYQIKGEFKVRNGCDRIVTLYDCNSNDLYINLSRLNLYYTDAYITYLETNPAATPDSYFTATGFYAWDCNKMQLTPNLKYPCMELEEILESSGSLEVGSYKFKLELLSSDFTRLGFSLFTAPVPVVDESLNTDWYEIDGATSSLTRTEDGGVSKVNKSIVLKVTDLAAPISYVRLVVKGYENADGITSYTLLKPDYIDVQGSTETLITFSSVDTEVDLPITQEEVTTPLQVYKTSCSQTQINNRLVRANLKEQEIDYSLVQQAANSIKTEWVVREFLGETTETNNSKKPEYYAFNQSYMRDEVYAFGIVLILKDGTYSPVFHIPGREVIQETDPFPYGTPSPFLDTYFKQGNFNTNITQRNGVPTGENWDKQLMTVRVNPNPNIAWSADYSQHTATFNPDTEVIIDEVEHLGFETKPIPDALKDIGFGAGKVPRWMIWNTAIRYIGGINDVGDFKNRGLMGYHELTTRYPGTLDCNGNFIYPIDADDPTKTAFIRHHRMPDIDTSSHIRVDASDEDGIYIRPLGVQFDTNAFYASLPFKLASQVEGHIFVRADRKESEKTVLDKGIYQVAWENDFDRSTATKEASNWFTPLRYNVLDLYECTSSIGTFTSPKIVGERKFPGVSNYMKNEAAIRPSFISSFTESGIEPKSLDFISLLKTVPYKFAYFDLKGANLGFPHSPTHTMEIFPNSGSNSSEDWWITPHYRASFSNRKYTNGKLVSPKANINLDVLVENSNPPYGLATGDTQIINRFNNTLQTNTVFIFEKKLGLPSGIIQYNNDHPAAELGQAGYNVFYTSIKTNKEVYSNLTTLRYLNISRCTEVDESLLTPTLEGKFKGDIFISRWSYTQYDDQTYIPDTPFTGCFIKPGIPTSQSDYPCNNQSNTYIDIDTGVKTTYPGLDIRDRLNIFQRTNKVFLTYVESEINTNLRHSGDETCNKYFEKNFNSSLDLYLPHLKDNKCQEYFAYNKDYSVVSKEDVFTPISVTTNLCSDCSHIYPNRITWSPKSFETEVTDNWKNNLANDFIDLPANTGQINNMKFDKNSLLITTAQSLFQMLPNSQELQTTEDVLSIGTGDFLSLPPREYLSKSFGYAGNQGRFNSVSTEYGWTWVDQEDGRIFNHTGQGVQEISRKGMYNWFKENLPSEFLKEMKKLNLPYPCKDNTSDIFNRSIGIFATYDPRFERYILHKRDFEFRQGLNIQGDQDLNDTKIQGALYYNLRENQADLSFTTWDIASNDYRRLDFNIDTDFFVNKCWTISYSYKYQTWLSWHSYMPNYMYYDNVNMFSFNNRDIGLSNFIYKHGNTNFQKFYGNKYDTIIELVVKDFHTRDFHNLYWYSNTEKLDLTEGYNVDIDSSTFDKLLVYTKRQTSGELALKLKLEDEDNLDWSNIEKTVIRKDRNYRVSGIRGLNTIQNTPMMTKNWFNTDYQNHFNQNGGQGYIDKVVNNLGLNIDPTDQENLVDIKDKYMHVRLWFSGSIHSSEDYKLILNLLQTSEFYSKR